MAALTELAPYRSLLPDGAVFWPAVSSDQTPLFDVLVGLHVGAALVSIGSFAATGLFANFARKRPGDEAVLRFFSPGRNLATRSVFLIPVFGVPLVGLQGGISEAQQPWMLAGGALWLLAVAVATAVAWPAEAELQHELQQGCFVSGPAGERARSGPAPKDQANQPTGGRARAGEALAHTARRLVGSAVLADAALVAAFVVMVVRPG